MPPTIAVLSTLDTKGTEAGYVADLITASGVQILLVDIGIQGKPAMGAHITRHQIAEAAHTSIEELRLAGRAAALQAVTNGATRLLTAAHDDGRVDAVLGFGGSSNTAVATAAMRALPFGVPKVMLSTVASADVRQYVQGSDITMMYSVVDIAGLNRLSRTVLANAANMTVGAVTPHRSVATTDIRPPLIAATMFGVTTPCVDAARDYFEQLGYEVVVFHATGAGGQSMEALIHNGQFVGVLDITTTELADEFASGLFSAGPHRLEAAAARGTPQVVCLGALDMANFLGPDTVPERLRGRHLFPHTPQVTLMRTSRQENEAVGKDIAAKLNQATGPVALFIPARGVSALSVAGGPFHDPQADHALFAALREYLRSPVELHEIDTDINDPVFARGMAQRLHQMITETET